jgi:N-acetylglucosamine kinase-like BadF-type ATPase
MTYVLGVDGGTSKTKALIARLDGTVVGHGKSAGSNIYEGDPHAGLEHGMQAAVLALESASLAAEELTASVFSMSGADWPEDLVFFRAAARARQLGKNITVVNDAIGGMRAGLPGLRAVGIICGTGAACAARNDAGEQWHSGFWQQGGAAGDLGRAALKAVYRADLGIDPATALTPALLERFEVSTPEELLHRQTALIAPELPGVAQLAPLVLDVATNGDAAARAIVQHLAAELAATALAGARKVGIEHMPYDVVLAGSVFRHPSPILPDAIIAIMRQHSPGITVLRRQHEPVFGALLLALESHGVEITDAIVRQIAATLPEGWQ